MKILGKDYEGSLQPSCSPRDPNVPHPTRVISYPNAISNLRNLLDNLGYEGQNYSEHSSKRGVATRSSEIGIDDNSIQVAGGWKDLRTVRKYIDRDPKQHQRLIARIFKL